MSWMISNWVERRAARDRHLRNVPELWKEVQTALAEACNSLEQHYPDVATVKRTKRSDNVALIAFTRSAPSSMAQGEMLRTRFLSLEFNPGKGTICVAVDGTVTQEFTIDADSDHIFVALRGRELLLDEFSRLVLEEAFFSPPIPKPMSLQQDSYQALEMAKELIRTLDAASDARMDKTAAIPNPV